MAIPDAPPALPQGPEPKLDKDVPFGGGATEGLFWPIRTKHKSGREVAYIDTDGNNHGKSDRRFLAMRKNGTRYHAGVDLWGNPGEVIVASESGKIVNIYDFYEGTDALIFQCDSGLVINFGEIEKKSPGSFGVKVGSQVAAGQPIAKVGKLESGSSMCHFETYAKGTTENHKWKTAEPKPPAVLRNPTKYLLLLATTGK